MSFGFVPLRGINDAVLAKIASSSTPPSSHSSWQKHNLKLNRVDILTREKVLLLRRVINMLLRGWR